MHSWVRVGSVVTALSDKKEGATRTLKTQFIYTKPVLYPLLHVPGGENCPCLDVGGVFWLVSQHLWGVCGWSWELTEVCCTRKQKSSWHMSSVLVQPCENLQQTSHLLPVGCDFLLVCYRLSVFCTGKFLGSVMAIKMSREKPWKDSICQSLHPIDSCIVYLPSALCPCFPPWVPEPECTNTLTDFSMTTQPKNRLEHMFEILITERQIVLG